MTVYDELYARHPALKLCADAIAAAHNALVAAYRAGGKVLACGNSANCVHAAEVMRAVGGKVVAFTGARPSALSRLADATIAVPETETYRVQELHLPVYHALCAGVEAELFA